MRFRDLTVLWCPGARNPLAPSRWGWVARAHACRAMSASRLALRSASPRVRISGSLQVRRLGVHGSERELSTARARTLAALSVGPLWGAALPVQRTHAALTGL